MYRLWRPRQTKDVVDWNEIQLALRFELLGSFRGDRQIKLSDVPPGESDHQLYELMQNITRTQRTCGKSFPDKTFSPINK